VNQSVPQVYIVDDDLSVRESVGRLIRSAGLNVKTFATVQEVLAGLEKEVPSCLVLDIQLPDIDGLELQEQLARKEMQIPIIFLTGHADIPMSVRAMKAGALEFLTKPFNDEYLLEIIREATRRQQGNREQIGAFGKIVGQSGAWRRIIGQVEIVAPTEATVLILGETGTGKELIAQEIHRCSRRRGKPLVPVNCTSIPKELFESEFFGHVRGAFTSAVRDRIGRFEAAEGGTLFLDEIGEIPLELQSKLLRVLQEKAYERVGDARTRTANVRIVAATNRDLKREIGAGRFREDLYYRLNVCPINVAPLRDRKDDIPLLASHFVETVVKELKCPRPRLTRAGIETLLNHDWPGNIRELYNLIQRAAIFAQGGVLEFDLAMGKTSAELTSQKPVIGDNSNAEYLTEAEIRRRERENLSIVLQKTGWKVKGAAGAAELLGVSPTTLFARIEKMGLRRPDQQPSLGLSSQG
jgi:DNA-binding NtrC family response regulator